jgi:hypothetical protein
MSVTEMGETQQTPLPVTFKPPFQTEEQRKENVAWTAKGQPWRIEPEIVKIEQQFLQRCLTISSEKGMYPFCPATLKLVSEEMHIQISKLTRAMIEYIFATHEKGAGPVLWEKERAKAPGERRIGPDFRGANLEGLNLSMLPFTCSLLGSIWNQAKSEWEKAAVNLRGAILWGTNLEGARLRCADLREADLAHAYLYNTQFVGANLIGASLREARIGSETDFTDAFMCATDGTAPRLQGVLMENPRIFAKTRDWRNIRRLGDEVLALPDLPKAKRIRALDDALLAYNQAEAIFRTGNLNTCADQCVYRSKILERKLRFLQGRRISWIWQYLQDLISGYGFKPERALIAVALHVCLFTFIYWYWGAGVSLSDTLLNSAMTLLSQSFYVPSIPHTVLFLYVNAIQIWIGWMLIILCVPVLIKVFTGR